MRADKRKDVWSEKKEETFGIVARSVVGVLMTQCGIEFFGREHAEHTTRDEQLRAEQARQGEKRSLVFEQHNWGRVSQQACFLAPQTAKPIVTYGSDERTNGSSHGQEANRS